MHQPAALSAWRACFARALIRCPLVDDAGMSLTDPVITAANKRVYLSHLAECGVIGVACTATQVSRDCVAKWRKNDPEFELGFQASMHHAADLLEKAARSRAVDGVQEPVFHKGEIVGYVQKYSDSLLSQLLRGNIAKYRERSHFELSGKIETSDMSAEQIREELAALVLATQAMAPNVHADSPADTPDPSAFI